MIVVQTPDRDRPMVLARRLHHGDRQYDRRETGGSASRPRHRWPDRVGAFSH